MCAFEKESERGRKEDASIGTVQCAEAFFCCYCSRVIYFHSSARVDCCQHNHSYS